MAIVADDNGIDIQAVIQGQDIGAMTAHSRVLNLAALCLFCLLPVGQSYAAMDGLISDLQNLAAKGVKLEVAFCNTRLFDAADCEMLLADFRAGRNTEQVNPTFIAATTSTLASRDEFSRCNLSVEQSFLYEDSDGIEALPTGPFELFREVMTEGQPDATLLSVSGYSSVSDPGSDPYSWKSFLLVPPEDSCHPSMLGFFRYGGSERPAKEFHEDGVIVWRHRTLIVTVSEAGPGFFRVDAYATHKSDDASTSQVAGFDITVTK